MPCETCGCSCCMGHLGNNERNARIREECLKRIDDILFVNAEPRIVLVVQLLQAYATCIIAANQVIGKVRPCQ
jgi:hypothetical protein